MMPHWLGVPMTSSWLFSDTAEMRTSSSLSPSLKLPAWEPLSPPSDCEPLRRLPIEPPTPVLPVPPSVLLTALVPPLACTGCRPGPTFPREERDELLLLRWPENTSDSRSARSPALMFFTS